MRAISLMHQVHHGPFGKIKIFLPNGPWRVDLRHGESRAGIMPPISNPGQRPL